jgi:hypothetical protein
MNQVDELSGKEAGTETKKVRRRPTQQKRKFRLVTIGFRVFKMFADGRLEMDGVGISQPAAGS